MKWPEITAMWLRERARKLREKADSIEDAYKSNAIKKYTSQVAGAYYKAAFDFEQLADQLEKENIAIAVPRCRRGEEKQR